MYNSCNFPRLSRWSFGLLVFAYLIFCSTLASAVDITLAWDASAGATGYRLFYHQQGQSYNYNSPACDVQILTCTVSGLDANKTYYFVVKAYNQYGESANSGEAMWSGSANQPPTADISANPTSGDAPLYVTFDASGSSDPDGTIVSYHWSFGDGVSATGASASHTYTSDCACTARLTVTDDGTPSLSDEKSVTITVGNVGSQPLPVGGVRIIN